MLWLNPESILIGGPPTAPSPLPFRLVPCLANPLQCHAAHVGQLPAEKSLSHSREPLRVVRHEELDRPRGPCPPDLRLGEQDVDDPCGLLGGVDKDGAVPGGFPDRPLQYGVMRAPEDH